MAEYIEKNLGSTIIHGKIPCDCIRQEGENVIVKVQEGLDLELTCETVCPHNNSFVIAEAKTEGPFVEPWVDVQKARIWINVE